MGAQESLAQRGNKIARPANSRPGVEGMMSHGKFFAVDWRCVEQAAKIGDKTNTALAVLVLARFTGRNHQTTKAGMTAIRNALGLSAGRADLALKTVERAGLVSPVTKGTSRSLRTWPEVLAANSKLTERQRTVFERVKGKTAPITSRDDPDYQVAYQLAQKGLFESIAKAKQPKFRLLQPDYVFLPNTIVDGFSHDATAGSDAPLARIRQIQDPRALLVLLDCYRLGNLPEDAGVPWQMVREDYHSIKVAEHGLFTVWGFNNGVPAAPSFDPLFTRFLTTQDHGENSAALWRVWNALISAGLLEFVPHIVESLEPGSQVIHPYAIPNRGEELEQKVCNAADAAGRRMVTDHKLAIAKAALGIRGTERPWLCPVRAHVTAVGLVGIARPIHRPQTRRTAAWAAMFLHKCEQHVTHFESLGQKHVKSRTSLAA